MENYKKQDKYFFCRFLIPFLAAGLLLGGCRGIFPPEPTAAPFGAETSESYEHFEEEQLSEQSRFQELENDLFSETIKASQLDMHFLLKSPETYDIDKADHLYYPFSLEMMEKDIREREELEQELSSFDSNLLTDDQKTTKRVLESYLKTERMADGLELYAQPLAVTIGTQAQLPILLSEYIFYTKKDVDEYLELLSGIDEYYQEILDFEKKKSEAGLMISDSSIDRIIESCESYLLLPDNNFMESTFLSRLEQIEELDDGEKDAYITKNRSILENDFVPAYQLLIDGLTELKGTGTNDGGQSGYPRGKEYYEYLVYTSTGTSYPSVDDMLKAMELAMDDYLDETSRLIRKHPELIDQIDTYRFRQTNPPDIIEELKTLSQDEFPELPECHYEFKNVPDALELSLSPAFYLVSPLDDYQNNVIYINHNPDYSSNDLYTIIAHEGYPGHLYQNVYYHMNCESKMRMLLSFPGYTEGWATFVEQKAYVMDNGLSPEMGKLLSANYMATLGLSACLDVYINYYGWNREDVKEYLSDFGDYSDDAVDSIFSTMVDNPANYLSYYVGCMEFQNMQKMAEKKLKAKFDAKAFHTFLLDMGTAPFDVIWPYFTSWLDGQAK